MLYLRRVLLVTTRSAYRLVLDVVRGLSKDYEIDVVPSSAVVAPFATCEDLASELSGRVGRCSYDVVLVPGLVRGSTGVIEERIGCRVYKGPRYAGDIPLVLELLERGVELSRDVPADELYSDLFASRLWSLYDAVVSSKRPQFAVGGLEVYPDPPPLALLLEVLVSDAKGFEEKISRAVEAGFDGVVVGCGVRCDAGALRERVDRARELFGGGAIGVDAPRPSDLPGDVLGAVDLVFNVTHADVDRIAGRIDRGKGVVVIPSTVDSLEDSLRSVEMAVSKLSEVGVSRVIVDPLVRPPGVGLAESLVRFYTSKRRVPYPHLFGTANVYEMIDADSHGVVALLTSVAVELGASLVLATEESAKAYGAIEEHSIARRMAYASYLKRSPPKDMPEGLDLLVVKGKRPVERPPPRFDGPVRVVDRLEFRQDPNYYVSVYVDHAGGYIVVDVARVGGSAPLARFVGKHPTSLARAVLREFGLTPEHAAYLGYELAKAEVALRLRKEYSQDSDVLVTAVDKCALKRGPPPLSRKKLNSS